MDSAAPGMTVSVDGRPLEVVHPSLPPLITTLGHLVTSSGCFPHAFFGLPRVAF